MKQGNNGGEPFAVVDWLRPAGAQAVNEGFCPIRGPAWIDLEIGDDRTRSLTEGRSETQPAFIRGRCVDDLSSRKRGAGLGVSSEKPTGRATSGAKPLGGARLTALVERCFYERIGEKGFHVGIRNKRHAYRDHSGTNGGEKRASLAATA